jgi:hypothetical protein
VGDLAGDGHEAEALEHPGDREELAGELAVAGRRRPVVTAPRELAGDRLKPRRHVAGLLVARAQRTALALDLQKPGDERSQPRRDAGIELGRVLLGHASSESIHRVGDQAPEQE